MAAVFYKEPRAPPAQFNQATAWGRPQRGRRPPPPRGRRWRKHSAKISFARLQGMPLAPYAACGRIVSRY